MSLRLDISPSWSVQPQLSPSAGMQNPRCVRKCLDVELVVDGESILLDSLSAAHAWQAILGILTCPGDQSQLCVSVNEMHCFDLCVFLAGITLVDALANGVISRHSTRSREELDLHVCPPRGTCILNSS